MSTNDRSLITELLDEAATRESTSRKLELAEALNRLRAQLLPLEDGAVYTFSRPGAFRRVCQGVHESTTLHYAGVVSGGKHFLTSRLAVSPNAEKAGPYWNALTMAGHLLGLGVSEVTVLRSDDGVVTTLAEPTGYPYIANGTRVRVVPTGILPAFDGTVYEHRHINEQLQYRVGDDRGGPGFWYAAIQVTVL